MINIAPNASMPRSLGERRDETPQWDRSRLSELPQSLRAECEAAVFDGEQSRDFDAGLSTTAANGIEDEA